ncbi:hypothetical protein D3C87_1462430 [compost metagenome]
MIGQLYPNITPYGNNAFIISFACKAKQGFRKIGVILNNQDHLIVRSNLVPVILNIFRNTVYRKPFCHYRLCLFQVTRLCQNILHRIGLNNGLPAHR